MQVLLGMNPSSLFLADLKRGGFTVVWYQASSKNDPKLYLTYTFIEWSKKQYFLTSMYQIANTQGLLLGDCQISLIVNSTLASRKRIFSFENLKENFLLKNVFETKISSLRKILIPVFRFKEVFEQNFKLQKFNLGQEKTILYQRKLLRKFLDLRKFLRKFLAL